MTPRLAGKRALVAGGAHGWGRAASLRLARDGASVVIVDDESDALDAVKREIEGFGGQAQTHVAMTDRPEALAAVAQAMGPGPLDILVTHYMRLDWSYVEDCDVETFAEVVRFNLVGPVVAVKAFLPMLKASAAGAVVHLGSVDGLHGNPRVPSYSASKGGLVSLTHVMAHEFAPLSIRVNAVASALTDQLPPDATEADVPPTARGGLAYVRQLNAATPLKRRGTPEQWAGPVAFLASDDAAYVTGAVLVVDCGRTTITAGTA